MLKFTLDEVLDKKNISISHLSKITGISRPSLTAIYNNTSRSVNLDFLEEIIDKLDITLNDLIIEKEIYPLTVYNTYKYEDDYEYYNIKILDRETSIFIFDEDIGLISKELYLKKTSSLYKDLGYKKEDPIYHEFHEQLFYLVCNPTSDNFDDIVTGSAKLIELVNIIGPKQLYSLLTKIISKGPNMKRFNKELPLAIIPLTTGKTYFFGFSKNEIVQTPLEINDEKKYRKVEFQNQRRSKSKIYY